MANASSSDASNPFPFLAQRKGFLISSQHLRTVDQIYLCLAIVVGCLGTLTNGLNVRTFSALGKMDGVTVSLLSLSLSDLFVCFLNSMHGVLLLCNEISLAFDIVFFVDTKVPNAFITVTFFALYSLTTMTTTFLALARCMCVLKPLHFRNTFTTFRSVVIHACFAVFCFGGYAPILSETGFRRVFDARRNMTRVVYWQSERRAEVKGIVLFFFDVIFTFSTEIVLVVCVLTMVHCLRKTGQFRHSMKAASGSAVVVPGSDQDEKEGFKLSGKELQVVKQVVLVSVLCIVSAFPKMYSAIHALLDPAFDVGKKLHNLYFTVGRFRRGFQIINSSTTFFVYYNFNSRFRALCFNIKPCSSSDGTGKKLSNS